MKRILMFLLIMLMYILPIFAEEYLISKITEDSFIEEKSFQVLISEISENSLITTEDKISGTISSKNDIRQFFENIGNESLEIFKSEEFKNAVTIYSVGMGFAMILTIANPPLGVLTMTTFKTVLIKNSIISGTAALAFFVRDTIKDFLKTSKAKICIEISDNEVIFINNLLLKEGNLVIYDKDHPIVFEYQDKIIETNSDGYIESIKSSVFIKAEGF